LRRDNPNTSFPKNIPAGMMTEYGMVPVKQLAGPDHNPLTHEVIYGPLPVNRNGTWVLVPTAVELKPEITAERYNSEIERVRTQRNELLAATDWTALSDVIIIPEIATYRQALRDITSQPGFPHNVSWPVKPE